jgi:hypothetical protein
VTLLVAALALAAARQPGVHPMLAGIAAEVRQACKDAEPIESDWALWSATSFLAAPPGAPAGPCRRDPALALKAARAIADAPSEASDSAMEFLGRAAAEGIGGRRDPAAAEAWYLRSWVLGHSGPWLQAIPVARRQAFLGSEAAIAMLRDRLRRGAPLPEKISLAQALIARRRRGDLDEAAALLEQFAPYAFDSAQVRVALARAILAGPASPQLVAEAERQLLRDVTSGPADVDRRGLLLAFGRRRLAAAATPEARAQAIGLVAAAATASEVQPMEALSDALRRENGGRAAATIDPIPGIRIPLTSEDYPPVALRAEEQGVVRLKALIDPSGRIVAIVPDALDQPPALVEGLRRIYLRRGPRTVEVPAPRPTPYLWMRLPPATFRIAS